MLSHLDDAASLNPRTVGAKAAWLAAGRRAGLPVLPGVVVHSAAGRPALAAGAAELGTRGSGRARLTALGVPIDPALHDALVRAVRPFGTRLVARSSSPLEGDGRWAGAFTSYVDVCPEDLGVAVAGCWASALAPDPLERARLTGSEPVDLAPAVLVQPAIAADTGGSAVVDGDGLRVMAVRGSPAPLLQGWDPGVVGHVAVDGTIDGDGLRTLVGMSVDALAETLLRAVTETRATAIEWAVVAGRPVILQLSRPANPEPAAADDVSGLLEGASFADRERLARMAAVIRRAPGPLGSALILPWALGEGPVLVSTVRPEPLDDHVPPDRRLAAAIRLAERLTAAAWAEPDDAPGDASRRASEAVAALRGPDPVAAAAILAARPAPDPTVAAAVWGAVEHVVVALVDAMGAADRDTAWALSPEQAAAALAGDAAAPGRLPRVDQWLPFQASVVLATGERRVGMPSGPGIGVGRVSIVGDVREVRRAGRRDVVLAPRPLPHLAPWLWDAAAVVTTGGGPGAHLFESARALGIPAVSGLAVDDELASRLAHGDAEWVMAVDGTAGTVSFAAW